MANDKQTKRERKDLAKKARLEAMRRAQRRRRMRKVWSGVIALAVIGAIVLGVVLSNKSNENRLAALNSLATTAGCTQLQKHGTEGATHVDPPQQIRYRTNPPSSGNHYGAWIRPLGPQTQPLNDENFVHNLEHGHVALLYKQNTPDSIKKALDDIARAQKTGVLSGVYADMQAEVGFSAWGSTLTCRADATKASQIADAAKEFIRVAGKKGPEGGGFIAETG